MMGEEEGLVGNTYIADKFLGACKSIEERQYHRFQIDCIIEALYDYKDLPVTVETINHKKNNESTKKESTLHKQLDRLQKDVEKITQVEVYLEHDGLTAYEWNNKSIDRHVYFDMHNEKGLVTFDPEDLVSYCKQKMADKEYDKLTKYLPYRATKYLMSTLDIHPITEICDDNSTEEMQVRNRNKYKTILRQIANFDTSNSEQYIYTYSNLDGYCDSKEETFGSLDRLIVASKNMQENFKNVNVYVDQNEFIFTFKLLKNCYGTIALFIKDSEGNSIYADEVLATKPISDEQFEELQEEVKRQKESEEK